MIVGGREENETLYGERWKKMDKVGKRMVGRQAKQMRLLRTKKEK